MLSPNASLQQLPHDGRANHAAVACHIDFLKCGHDALLRPKLLRVHFVLESVILQTESNEDIAICNILRIKRHQKLMQ